MKTYLLSLILLLSGWTVKGVVDEQPVIIPFRYSNELNSGNITSVSQDTNGQIWLTTTEHLYNFDGYTVNKIDLPSHPALTVQTEIMCVFGDSRNRIWIGSGGCIYCYDQNHKTTAHYFAEPDDILNMGNIVYQVAEAPDKTIYFATRNGIFYFDETAKTLKRFSIFPWHKVCSGYKKEERIVSALHITPAGILWGGTEGDGIWRISLKDGKSMHFYPTPGDQNSIKGKMIHAIYEDEFGVLWIGTEQGISIFRKETSGFTNIGPEEIPADVTSICETGNGDLLFGSNNGLFIYDRKNQTGQKINILSNPALLSYSSTISVLKRDRSGSIWIGTKKGLACGYTAHEFTLHKHNPDTREGIASNSVSFLTPCPETSGLWITHVNGDIDYHNPAQNSFRHYTLKQAGNQYTVPITTYRTADREFLIGTTGGILHFNHSKAHFEPLTFPFCKQSFQNTYAILKDRSGSYWFGVLDEGVFRVNPATKTCERIPVSYEKIHKNIYTNIKIIYEDREGYIWIVFWRAGVLRYHPQTGEEKLFTQENTGTLLPNNTIWDIREDLYGRLVFATAGGLGIWDFDQGKFTGSVTGKSVKGEYIVGMEENKADSSWWLATTNGIIHLSSLTGNSVRYTEADGLQGNIFKSHATAQVDSFFFFGGNYGLNRINVNQPVKNTYIPSPRLLRIIVNGTETTPNLLPLKNGMPCLKLNKGDKAEIYFSSFSYNKEWRNYYKTGLQTGDSITWSSPQQKNSITFTPAQTGKTYLQLTASNSDGLWSTPRRILRIEVRSPYRIPVISGITTLILVAIGISCRKPFLRRLRRRKAANRKNKTLKAQPDASTLQLQEKFRQLMDKEQLYLNKRFSKIEMAGRLKLNEQQLTLFLKNYYGKGFPELINHYRVEAVKHKMEEPRYKDYTLFALGEECGFNSRSSFYRVFKEYTGLTPAEYQDKLGKSPFTSPETP